MLADIAYAAAKLARYKVFVAIGPLASVACRRLERQLHRTPALLSRSNRKGWRRAQTALARLFPHRTGHATTARAGTVLSRRYGTSNSGDSSSLLETRASHLHYCSELVAQGVETDIAQPSQIGRK